MAYVRDEEGGEKSDLHLAGQTEETHRTTCREKLVMKGVIVEPAK